MPVESGLPLYKLAGAEGLTHYCEVNDLSLF